VCVVIEIPDITVYFIMTFLYNDKAFILQHRHATHKRCFTGRYAKCIKGYVVDLCVVAKKQGLLP
jgi:hypothetical protein